MKNDINKIKYFSLTQTSPDLNLMAKYRLCLPSLTTGVQFVDLVSFITCKLLYYMYYISRVYVGPQDCGLKDGDDL